MAKETYGYLVAFAAAIGGLLFGYEIGVVSQTLSMTSFGIQFDLITFIPNLPLQDGSLAFNGSVIESLKPFPDSTCLKFNSTHSTCETESAAGNTGLVTFTFLIGCALGAVIVSFLADWWGRKRCIILSGVFFLLGGAFQSLSNSFAVFFGGRGISGIAVGVLSMVVPLYISESAPTSIRGRMIAIQQLMVTIGIVIASIVNTLIIVLIGKKDPLNGLEWRLALAMQCVPALALSVIMLFMPESPRWLAEKGREDEALATIAKLRSSKESDRLVQEEFGDILDGVKFERTIGTGSWSELFTKGLYNRVAITCTLQLFQQWTGINVILYYQSQLLQGMGLDPDQANIPFTIANNVVNMLATFPGMYLIEKIGRRPLLLFGGLGMGTAHYLVCLFLNLAKTYTATGGPVSLMYYLAIFSVYVFLICFSSSWGPVAWVYQSEVFPLRVRGKGTGLATLSNWLNNAVIAFVVPMIQKSLKPNEQQMYLIFGKFIHLMIGTTGMMMATFVYFFVPETMSKSLEEMDDLFGAPEGGSKAERDLWNSEEGKKYRKNAPVVGGH